MVNGTKSAIASLFIGCKGSRLLIGKVYCYRKRFAGKLVGFEEPVGHQVNLNLTIDTDPIIIKVRVVSMRAYLCVSLLQPKAFAA